MIRGRKAFYLYFFKPFSFNFWVLGELESADLTLDFERFSSKIHCQVEIKTVSNFPYFLDLPTVTSQVLFPIIIHNFLDRSTIMKDKKQ